MKSSENKIIITYLIISGLFTLSASLIWGINTLFLLKAGMNIFQVFVVNAIYSASMALFEIPTGVFADTLGRRTSFLASTLVLMFGTLGYVFAASIKDNFWLFGIMSIILGLAYTFYSGAVEAWLVDALKATGYAKELDGVFSKGSMVSNIAMLVGTTAGGALGTLSLSIPYIVRAIMQLFVFVIAFFLMQDIGYNKKELKLKNIPTEMKRIGKESINYGVKNLSIRYLMIVSFIFSSFMMWGWYAWQPYFLKLYGNTNAVWIAGVISAALALSEALGNLVIGIINSKFKRRTSMMFIFYGIQALSIIAIGFANSFWIAVGSFLCFSFTVGSIMPIKQSYLHKLIPSEQRATIVSFDSLVGSSGSVIGQVGYGYLSEKISIGSGYIVGGFVNILILPVLILLKRRNDKEDLVKC